MRKLFSILLAVLLVGFAGMAVAHNIAYDPQTGHGVITVPVHNNDNNTVSKGDTVIWDIDASTGDDDAYINVSTTADTTLVAGIVWPADIVSGGQGSIAIWGLVQCDVTGTVAADSNLCVSTTEGEADVCANIDRRHAIATAAGTDALVNCFVNTR